jgi:UDP-glucuronate 4-epimerase
MAILLTGSAGVIGFHVASALLDRGERVIGVDSLNAYYDPALKQARLARLDGRAGFAFHHLDIAEPAALFELVDANPDIDGVVNLAAQAGVHYSIENTWAYIDANVRGQVTVLEASRRLPRLKHVVYASSSSVYGGNTKVPFAVGDPVGRPVSTYAASKRAAELMAETHAHLYGFPVTGLRFFTVYGPWGRPDMAYYSFTGAILGDAPIRVFNEGDMKRDFTYIDDIVEGVVAALERPPAPDSAGRAHRIYNLGNNRAESLRRFIAVIEQACGRKARQEPVGMQPGDVKDTWADIESARCVLGFEPRTSIDEGIPRFVAWYRDYHGL